MGTKYNAQSNEFNGIKFASLAERDYYIHLCDKYASGEILGITLQPKYELQPAFVNAAGNLVRSINYTADFEIVELDNTLTVVDVRGFETSDFKLKKKMFEYKHQTTIKLMSHTVKYGWEESLDKKFRIKQQEKEKKMTTV